MATAMNKWVATAYAGDMHTDAINPNTQTVVKIESANFVAGLGDRKAPPPVGRSKKPGKPSASAAASNNTGAKKRQQDKVILSFTGQKSQEAEIVTPAVAAFYCNLQHGNWERHPDIQNTKFKGKYATAKGRMSIGSDIFALDDADPCQWSKGFIRFQKFHTDLEIEVLCQCIELRQLDDTAGEAASKLWSGELKSTLGELERMKRLTKSPELEAQCNELQAKIKELQFKMGALPAFWNAREELQRAQEAKDPNADKLAAELEKKRVALRPVLHEIVEWMKMDKKCVTDRFKQQGPGNPGGACFEIEFPIFRPRTPEDKYVPRFWYKPNLTTEEYKLVYGDEKLGEEELKTRKLLVEDTDLKEAFDAGWVYNLLDIETAPTPSKPSVQLRYCDRTRMRGAVVALHLKPVVMCDKGPPSGAKYSGVKYQLVKVLYLRAYQPLPSAAASATAAAAVAGTVRRRSLADCQPMTVTTTQEELSEWSMLHRHDNEALAEQEGASSSSNSNSKGAGPSTFASSSSSTSTPLEPEDATLPGFPEGSSAAAAAAAATPLKKRKGGPDTEASHAAKRRK